MQEKLNYIYMFSKSGDLKRCSEAFDHNYDYLRQVARGEHFNEQMLEDIITTINTRVEMEKKLADKAKKQKENLTTCA